MMIVLCNMLVGNPEWSEAEIHINAAVPEEQAAEEVWRLEEMIATGRIPISRRNLSVFPTVPEADFDHLVAIHSARADLTVIGFTTDRLEDKGAALFERHPTIGDLLFVCGRQEIRIE